MFSFTPWDSSTRSLFLFYVHRFLTRLICLLSSWLSPLIVFLPAVTKWPTGATIRQGSCTLAHCSGGSPIMAGKESYTALCLAAGAWGSGCLHFGSSGSRGETLQLLASSLLFHPTPSSWEGASYIHCGSLPSVNPLETPSQIDPRWVLIQSNRQKMNHHT